jgi:hypothetical protein
MPASSYDSLTTSPFAFKADDAAAADRSNRLDIATINAVGRVMGSRGLQAQPQSPTFGAAAPANDAGPTPEQMGLGAAASGQAPRVPAASTPAAPAPQLDAFQQMQQQLDPLRAAASNAAMGQLQNPAAAFDAGAKVQQENLDKSQQQLRQQQRDDLIKSGLNGEQVRPMLNQFDQQSIIDQRTLGRDLAAGRSAATLASTTEAIKNAMGISTANSADKQFQAQLGDAAASRASQEKIAFAGLTQRENEVAQQASQAKDRLEFDKLTLSSNLTEAEKNRVWNAVQQGQEISSREKIAFAGLSVQQAELAQQGLLAKDRLDFDKLTLSSNLSEAEKNRVWNAVQQQQDIDSRVKIAGMQIGSAERLQAADQMHQSAEKERDRVLAGAMQKTGIDATATLEANRQEFELALTDKGFLQTKELETLRNQFAQNLQAQGFDHDTAMQAADQQFRSLTAVNEQRYNAQQAELQRAWQHGENVDAATITQALQANEIRSNETRDKLNATLQLDLVDKRSSYEKALQAAEQTFQKAMQENGYNQAKATQAADQVFQAAMQSAGFTQQQAMQAKQLTHDASESEKLRLQQWNMFAATQAMDDEHFAAELGIKKEEIRNQWVQTEAQIGIALRGIGIQESQWAELKQKDGFDRQMELAMTGLQLAGDDEAAQAPFVDKLAAQLGKGLGLDETILQKAIKESRTPAIDQAALATGAATGKQRAEAFSDVFDKTSSLAGTDAEAVKETLIKVNNLANTLTDKIGGVADDGLYRDILSDGERFFRDRAVATTKNGKVESTTIGTGAAAKDLDTFIKENFSSVKVGDYSKHTARNGTQLAMDAGMFQRMLSKGMTEANAKTAFTALVGGERATKVFTAGGVK